jgi:hypothetical protein
VRVNFPGAFAMRWAILAIAAVLAGGAGVPIGGEVAQSGSRSGIQTTVFTAWLPAGLAFGGVRGIVSLIGNDSAFSEALVVLGTTGDAMLACAHRDNTSVNGLPTVNLLWATILKSNDTTVKSVHPNFALPFAVPVPRQGACMAVFVNAGYPFLSTSIARYTDTIVALDVLTPPAVPGIALIVPFGVGGEFRFTPAQMVGGTAYVGIRAEKTLIVDAIAGAVSAAPVLGAPPANLWLPLPAGRWLAETPFYFMPAAVCAAGQFRTGPSIGRLSVVRDATPAAVPLPEGALPVLTPGVLSEDTQAAQSGNFAMYPALGSWDGVLEPGDCLISYIQARSYNGGSPGVMDFEAQSTVYLRPAQ